MLEDKVLIWRFNRGDRDALRHIYIKYKGHLLRIAAALSEDRNVAEDVLHDVFVSFADTVGNFRLSGSLKGYLAICIANRARDMNRALRRRSATRLDNAQRVLPNREGPENAAISKELSQILDDAMAQLPYDQREVIILRLQGKMGFRHMAKSRCVSTNTIRSRYRYGLNKLRSILDGMEK